MFCVNFLTKKKFWSLFFRLATCLHLFVVLATVSPNLLEIELSPFYFHVLYMLNDYIIYIFCEPFLVEVANQRTAQGSQFSTLSRARTKVVRLSFVHWAISLALFSFTLIILRLLEDTYKVVYFKRKDITMKLRIKNIKINTTFPSEKTISNERCSK